MQIIGFKLLLFDFWPKLVLLDFLMYSVLNLNGNKSFNKDVIKSV